MKSLIDKNLNSIVLFVIIGLIVFGSYFLDKDLSKTLGVAGFFVWFLREYSKQLLTKDLEKFKSELQRETLQFKIRYEKLHTERAEVIKEIYKKISKTHKAFNFCMGPLQLGCEISVKDVEEKAKREFSELEDFYNENRLFFEENLAIRIDELVKEFRKAMRHHLLCMDPQTKDQIIEMDKAWTKIIKDVPAIKQDIEKRFREIIGVEKQI